MHTFARSAMNAIGAHSCNAFCKSALATLSGIAAGCSAFANPPNRPVRVRLWPGLTSLPAADRASLPPIALADVEQKAAPPSAVRLNYAGRPTTAPLHTGPLDPAARVTVAATPARPAGPTPRRAADADAAAQALTPPAAANCPPLLRIELEDSATSSPAPPSTGLPRLRATSVDPTLAGETLLGQRVHRAKPAFTPTQAAPAPWRGCAAGGGGD